MKIPLEKFEALCIQLLSSHRIYFYPFLPYFTSFFKYSCRICLSLEYHFKKQLPSIVEGKSHAVNAAFL